MSGTIFKFFFGFFLKGAFIGLILRFLLYSVAKIKATPGGLFRTCLATGLITCIIVLIGLYV